MTQEVIRINQFVEDWPLQLRQAIEKAGNDAILVVDDETKKKFAMSALVTFYPAKHIKVITRQEALEQIGPENAPDNAAV